MTPEPSGGVSAQPHGEPEGGRVVEAQEASTVTPSPTSASTHSSHAHWLVRHRYLMLGAAVTVLTSIQTKNGQWTTDMWEHVAVVRALIKDPYHATRTLTLLNTPYSVTLGLLGRLFGTSAITILSFAAVANVVLFLVAFRCFVLAATRNVS